MMKRLLPIVLAVLTLTGYSQNTKDNRLKKTIRGSFQLPAPMSSKAFKSHFSGVFNSTLSYSMGRKLNVGAEYAFTQYQVFPKVNTDPHPVQMVHSLGTRLSYDFPPSGIFMMSPFAGVQYNWIEYHKLIYPPSLHPDPYHNAISACAGLDMFWMYDDWDAIGLTVSYHFSNYHFEPEDAGLSGFTAAEVKGLTHYITFGFSAYFNFTDRPEPEGFGD